MIADEEDRLVIRYVLQTDCCEFDSRDMPDAPEGKLNNALHNELDISVRDFSDDPKDTHDRERKNKINPEQNGYQY